MSCSQNYTFFFPAVRVPKSEVNNTFSKPLWNVLCGIKNCWQVTLMDFPFHPLLRLLRWLSWKYGCEGGNDDWQVLTCVGGLKCVSGKAWLANPVPPFTQATFERGLRLACFPVATLPPLSEAEQAFSTIDALSRPRCHCVCCFSCVRLLQLFFCLGWNVFLAEKHLAKI